MAFRLYESKIPPFTGEKFRSFTTKIPYALSFALVTVKKVASDVLHIPFLL
jgi:hypothetical protein